MLGIQTGCGVHPASCSAGTTRLVTGDKLTARLGGEGGGVWSRKLSYLHVNQDSECLELCLNSTIRLFVAVLDYAR